MKLHTLCILGLTLVGSRAGDWTQEITKNPGAFAPLRPLKATYRLGWGSMLAGRAEVEYSQAKSGNSEMHVTGSSAGAVRALWKMDSDSISTLNPQTLLPIKLVQKETYSDESRTTTVEFGAEETARKRDRTPPDKDSGKTKKFKFAPVHDLASALLFVRSQPLDKGDSVQLAVYPAARAYLANVEVLGRENVKVNGRTWPAIKLALQLRKIDKNLKLEDHKKFKRLIGWISDDADRVLLKIESEVMVGKVWMEMNTLAFQQN